MPEKIIFTQEQILKIIDMYADGQSCKNIGLEFACSEQTINKILKEKNIKICKQIYEETIYIKDGYKIKCCTNCNQEKLIEDFPFIKDIQQFNAQCKECISIKNKIWRENRIIQIKETDNGQEKQCNICKEIKLISEFNFRKDNGCFKNYCKICQSIKNKIWRDLRIPLVKKFDEDNDLQQCTKCKIIKPLKEFYFRKDSGSYRTDCKNCMNENKKSFRLEHIEEIQEYQIIYRNNPDNKLKAKKKVNMRRRIDPEFAFKKDTSSIIARIMRSNGGSKNNQSSWEHINWNYEQIIDFFEQVYFTIPGNEWMNRNNRGKYDIKTWDDNDLSTWTWHLDHIIPHSFFHYSSFEHPDFLKCWNIKNLRPLNGKQNIKDNNRRSEKEIKKIQMELEERLKLLQYKL